jgi:hypothetical protein
MLCVDVMYVNTIPMLVTLSRNIHFGTVEALPSCSKANILKAIHNVLRVYRGSGFKVQTALMDGEFATMEGDLMDDRVRINVTARDEHVSEIERYI